MPQQRAHDVHLRMPLAGDAAGCIDFLQDHRRRAQRQARAAIFLRDQRAEEPGLRSVRQRIRSDKPPSPPARSNRCRDSARRSAAQSPAIRDNPRPAPQGFLGHRDLLQQAKFVRLAAQPWAPGQTPANSAAVMRILFVTSNRLGDAVLSTGLLDHLIRTYPSGRITVVCGPVAEGVFAAHAEPSGHASSCANSQWGLHWLPLWLPTLPATAGTWWSTSAARRCPGWSRPPAARSSAAGGGPKTAAACRRPCLSPPPIPVAWISDADAARVTTLLPPANASSPSRPLQTGVPKSGLPNVSPPPSTPLPNPARPPSSLAAPETLNAPWPPPWPPPCPAPSTWSAN